MNHHIDESHYWLYKYESPLPLIADALMFVQKTQHFGIGYRRVKCTEAEARERFEKYKAEQIAKAEEQLKKAKSLTFTYF